MTDLWWPPGYGKHPAFQVQRQIYGAAEGGDYVRGSAQFKGTLSGAGAALPSSPVPGDMWLLGTPVPTAAPNPPTGVKAAGNVIRWDTSWTNLGTIVQTVGTAVRYPTGVANATSIAGKSILHVTPTDHTTVRIEWGWPKAPNDSWREVALVRSAFGRPSTVNDGQTIFRALRAAFLDPEGEFPLDPATGDVADPPVRFDTPLPAGRWYHYGLFFKVSDIEWVRGMVDSTLLPRDLLHATHLWNNIPPYYQWVDDQPASQGFLQPFLGVFGFELDQCREFIESWQHVYDSDWSPIRLLRHLGPNFGIPYESGIGDIRYRSLMADIGHLYEIRGTQPSLTELISNMSKYECVITAGSSLMLSPDDSDFYQSTGNWAGLHPETVIAGQTVLAPDHVKLAKSAQDEATPLNGRGSMKVWTSLADATAKVLITCGDGLQYPGNTTNLALGVELLPKTHGIPVQAQSSYGFSVSVKVSAPSLSAQVGLLWFGQDGEPYNLLASVFSDIGVGSVSDLNWHDLYIEGKAPAKAMFVVPALLFTARVAGPGPTDSPYIYVAGAMVYYVGGAGAPLVVPPDRYLTMGDPGELIGAADAAGHPSFDPYILGNPEQK